MEFAEPHRIEADMIAELDLREDVLVTLALRIAGSTGQLVEEPEAHWSSPIGTSTESWPNAIAWRRLGGQAGQALDSGQGEGLKPLR